MKMAGTLHQVRLMQAATDNQLVLVCFCSFSQCSWDRYSSFGLQLPTIAQLVWLHTRRKDRGGKGKTEERCCCCFWETHKGFLESWELDWEAHTDRKHQKGWNVVTEHKKIYLAFTIYHKTLPGILPHRKVRRNSKYALFSLYSQQLWYFSSYSGSWYIETENICYFSDQRTQANTFFLTEKCLFYCESNNLDFFTHSGLFFLPLVEILSSFYLMWSIVIEFSCEWEWSLSFTWGLQHYVMFSVTSQIHSNSTTAPSQASRKCFTS